MRRARGQRGQILPVVALALVALLGVTAFSIDVGYAYYAKRQLQSAVDAAALAGAQDLPQLDTGAGDGADVLQGQQSGQSPGLRLLLPAEVHGNGHHRDGLQGGREPE